MEMNDHQKPSNDPLTNDAGNWIGLACVSFKLEYTKSIFRHKLFQREIFPDHKSK